jgi:hypothetical protein
MLLSNGTVKSKLGGGLYWLTGRVEHGLKPHVFIFAKKTDRGLSLGFITHIM